MIENSIQINTAISLMVAVLSAGGTAAGMWYGMKGRISKIDICMKNLEKKHHEDHLIVNKKIDDTEKDIEKLDKKVEKKTDEINIKLDDMNRIINEGQISQLQRLSDMQNALLTAINK